MLVRVSVNLSLGQRNHSLMLMLAAYQYVFVFLISSHVGFVPVRMFWLFLSLIGDGSFRRSFGAIQKKNVLVDKFWEAPGVPKQNIFFKSKSIY